MERIYRVFLTFLLLVAMLRDVHSFLTTGPKKVGVRSLGALLGDVTPPFTATQITPTNTATTTATTTPLSTILQQSTASPWNYASVVKSDSLSAPSTSASLIVAVQEYKTPTAEELAQKKMTFNMIFWGGGFVAPFLATIFYFGFRFWER